MTCQKLNDRGVRTQITYPWSHPRRILAKTIAIDTSIEWNVIIGNHSIAHLKDTSLCMKVVMNKLFFS